MYKNLWRMYNNLRRIRIVKIYLKIIKLFNRFLSQTHLINYSNNQLIYSFYKEIILKIY